MLLAGAEGYKESGISEEGMGLCPKRPGNINGEVRDRVLYSDNVRATATGCLIRRRHGGNMGGGKGGGDQRPIRKVRKQRGETTGAAESELDEKEVEQTFWFSRPDGWVVNRKTK